MIHHNIPNTQPLCSDCKFYSKKKKKECVSDIYYDPFFQVGNAKLFNVKSEFENGYKNLFKR